jgi:micrococcal nuclease
MQAIERTDPVQTAGYLVWDQRVAGSNPATPIPSRTDCCTTTIMRTLFVHAILGLAVAPAAAYPACGLYEYKATITSVHDGDTITADVDLGFHVWINDEKFRLMGIDAPELPGAAGVAARDALAKRILGREMIICTVKDRREKFGRYLVRVYDGDELLNDWMVANGYAVPYDGGKR